MPSDSPSAPGPGDDGSRAGVAVDLFWIPLGAGAHAAQVSGRIYEAASALLARRERRDLYHSHSRSRFRKHAGVVVATRDGRGT
jgi:hypothetical protein